MIRRLLAPLAVFVVLFAMTLSVAAIVRREMPPIGVAPSGASAIPSFPAPRPSPTPSPTAAPSPTPIPEAPPILPPLPTVAPSDPLPALLVTCGNGVDNSGGLGLICEVTITPSLVTVRECHGAAGAPTASCRMTVSVGRATEVRQCNDSINGGGGTMRCTVDVTTHYVGVIPGLDFITVNQCVGSGATTGCHPFPATASGATITQCNGSANGGTLVSLSCTASGTASAVRVTVNQCNGSANGGGALLICSAHIGT